MRYVTIKDGRVIADAESASEPAPRWSFTYRAIPAEHVNVRLMGSSAEDIEALLAGPKEKTAMAPDGRPDSPGVPGNRAAAKPAEGDANYFGGDKPSTPQPAPHREPAGDTPPAATQRLPKK